MLNPIEQAFAKLNGPLDAKAPRTVEALWNAISGIVGCLTPDGRGNYVRDAGYFQSG